VRITTRVFPGRQATALVVEARKSGNALVVLSHARQSTTRPADGPTEPVALRGSPSYNVLRLARGTGCRRTDQHLNIRVASNRPRVKA
jgi:hypothetical protein